MSANKKQSSFWLDRKVLVTGCTGLVGSWLVHDLVEAGADVIGLIRDQVHRSHLVRMGLDRKITVVRGGVEDYELMERVLNEHEVQTVMHLAAQTIVGIANRNPLSTFEANIKGTWCLLEAARRTKIIEQIVVASSDKAYGDQPVLPYDENTPLQGTHPYDVSKSCADLICRTYFVSYKLPVCVTRCGNFYGPGDLNWNRIVPGTVRSVIRGERPIIRSDGTLIRDYFYVRDGAAGYMFLAEKMAQMPQIHGEAFNFSNEIQMTVLQITDKILRAMDSKLQPVVLNQASNEILHQYLSAKKAREMLGWAPRWNLDSALPETVAWYRRLLTEDPKAGLVPA